MSSPCSGTVTRRGRLGVPAAGSSPSDSPLLHELELREGITVGAMRVVREGSEACEGWRSCKRNDIMMY